MSADLAPWDHLVTYERVIGLHGEVLTADGGMASDPHESKGCVEGSLGGAWTAELYATEGDDAIRQGLVFAGYLLFYLAKNHCFGDGNKRTALASMQEVLSVLGLTIDVNDDELVTYVLAVAGGTVKSAPDVVKWLAQRLTELK